MTVSPWRAMRLRAKLRWAGRQEDGVSQRELEEIVSRYEHTYPGAFDFSLDWNSNVCSFRAKWEEGRRRILLFGGVTRIPGVQGDGLALLIAHEVAHFRNLERKEKSCINPNRKLLREGHADYEAARFVMREVWQQQYEDKMGPAIEQFGHYLSYSCSRGLGYPSDDCRIDTLRAGVAERCIPDCATKSGISILESWWSWLRQLAGQSRC